MKNDTLNVFMAFLHIALRKKVSIFYFIERLYIGQYKNHFS